MHARVESERDGKWGTLAGRTKPISYIPVETSTPLENRSRFPRVYYAVKEEQREAENCELSWLDFIFVISFVAQICRETRNVRSGFYLRLDSWFYDRTGKGTVYHLAVWREERRNAGEILDIIPGSTALKGRITRIPTHPIYISI